MSRIGKKPIEVPKGVKFTFLEGKAVVEGPKGKVDVLVPQGVSFEQQDGNLVANRVDDSKAAFHGLARALMQNAVTGVTTGWTKDLDIVGIGLTGNPAFDGDRDAAVKGATHILITHGHSDHVGDTVEIAAQTGAKVVTNYDLCMWLASKGVQSFDGKDGAGAVRAYLGIH